ncbi:MAG: DUF4363 family protein [Ruminococcus sp.]|nr:DUF4363 family protein [Ruminococcus sp.]
MTRTWLSIGLICSLAVISVLSGVWVNSRCGKMMNELEDILTLAEEDRTDEAVRAARQLEEEWEDFRRPASVIVNNSKLGELDRGYAGIEYALEAEHHELAQLITELIHMTQLLRDGETPGLYTVL